MKASTLGWLTKHQIIPYYFVHDKLCCYINTFQANIWGSIKQSKREFRQNDTDNDTVRSTTQKMSTIYYFIITT